MSAVYETRDRQSAPSLIESKRKVLARSHIDLQNMKPSAETPIFRALSDRDDGNGKLNFNETPWRPAHGSRGG